MSAPDPPYGASGPPLSAHQLLEHTSVEEVAARLDAAIGEIGDIVREQADSFLESFPSPDQDYTTNLQLRAGVRSIRSFWEDALALGGKADELQESLETICAASRKGEAAAVVPEVISKWLSETASPVVDDLKKKYNNKTEPFLLRRLHEYERAAARRFGARQCRHGPKTPGDWQCWHCGTYRDRSETHCGTIEQLRQGRGCKKPRYFEPPFVLNSRTAMIAHHFAEDVPAPDLEYYAPPPRPPLSASTPTTATTVSTATNGLPPPGFVRGREQDMLALVPPSRQLLNAATNDPSSQKLLPRGGSTSLHVGLASTSAAPKASAACTATPRRATTPAVAVAKVLRWPEYNPGAIMEGSSTAAKSEGRKGSETCFTSAGAAARGQDKDFFNSFHGTLEAGGEQRHRIFGLARHIETPVFVSCDSEHSMLYGFNNNFCAEDEQDLNISKNTSTTTSLLPERETEVKRMQHFSAIQRAEDAETNCQPKITRNQDHQNAKLQNKYLSHFVTKETCEFFHAIPFEQAKERLRSILTEVKTTIATAEQLAKAATQSRLDLAQAGPDIKIAALQTSKAVMKKQLDGMQWLAPKLGVVLKAAGKALDFLTFIVDAETGTGSSTTSTGGGVVAAAPTKNLLSQQSCKNHQQLQVHTTSIKVASRAWLRGTARPQLQELAAAWEMKVKDQVEGEESALRELLRDEQELVDRPAQGNKSAWSQRDDDQSWKKLATSRTQRDGLQPGEAARAVFINLGNFYNEKYGHDEMMFEQDRLDVQQQLSKLPGVIFADVKGYRRRPPKENQCYFVAVLDSEPARKRALGLGTLALRSQRGRGIQIIRYLVKPHWEVEGCDPPPRRARNTGRSVERNDEHHRERNNYSGRRGRRRSGSTSRHRKQDRAPSRSPRRSTNRTNANRMKSRRRASKSRFRRDDGQRESRDDVLSSRRDQGAGRKSVTRSRRHADRDEREGGRNSARTSTPARNTSSAARPSSTANNLVRRDDRREDRSGRSRARSRTRSADRKQNEPPWRCPRCNQKNDGRQAFCYADCGFEYKKPEVDESNRKNYTRTPRNGGLAKGWGHVIDTSSHIEVQQQPPLQSSTGDIRDLSPSEKPRAVFLEFFLPPRAEDHQGLKDYLFRFAKTEDFQLENYAAVKDGRMQNAVAVFDHEEAVTRLAGKKQLTCKSSVSREEFRVAVYPFRQSSVSRGGIAVKGWRIDFAQQQAIEEERARGISMEMRDGVVVEREVDYELLQLHGVDVAVSTSVRHDKRQEERFFSSSSHADVAGAAEGLAAGDESSERDMEQASSNNSRNVQQHLLHERYCKNTSFKQAHAPDLPNPKADLLHATASNKKASSLEERKKSIAAKIAEKRNQALQRTNKVLAAAAVETKTKKEEETTFMSKGVMLPSSGAGCATFSTSTRNGRLLVEEDNYTMKREDDKSAMKQGRLHAREQDHGDHRHQKDVLSQRRGRSNSSEEKSQENLPRVTTARQYRRDEESGLQGGALSKRRRVGKSRMR
ncbi:unnamed protein product [Amoebophrya sp. A120]|nr:unnamed protein product [Amoebophrya sp. A120]|eukprot:GSA120T00022541001.1